MHGPVERRASVEQSATRDRARPSHALRNDAALDVATIAVIAGSGWDEFSVNKVSKAAGLTNGAVHARHSGKTALGIDAWHRLLSGPLFRALDAVITAGMAGGTFSPGASAASLTSFTEAMEAFVRPSLEIRAALELVMGSQFEAQARAGIFGPASEWLRSKCRPGGDGHDPARAAQATAIAVWALGLVLVANRPWVESMNVSPAIARIHHALTNPAAPSPLPPATATYLRESPYDTGDPRVDTILASALESIGTVGFQRTRVLAATQAAGVSESFAFTRYPSKLDLFLAVIDSGYAQAYAGIIAFRESVAAEQGIGLAEAVTWREYLRPEVAGRMIASLETDRLTRYSERMRDLAFAAETALLDGMLADVPKADRPAITGHLHLDFASGHGLPLIGVLLPDSWQLPFDVVTVPETAAHPMPS